MTKLEDVVRWLLFHRPGDPSPHRSVERLDEGVFHVDHHDPGHVYLVTVRKVPWVALPLAGRHPLPDHLHLVAPRPVGEAAGVRA